MRGKCAEMNSHVQYARANTTARGDVENPATWLVTSTLARWLRRWGVQARETCGVACSPFCLHTKVLGDSLTIIRPLVSIADHEQVVRHETVFLAGDRVCSHYSQLPFYHFKQKLCKGVSIYLVTVSCWLNPGHHKYHWIMNTSQSIIQYCLQGLDTSTHLEECSWYIVDTQSGRWGWGLSLL